MARVNINGGGHQVEVQHDGADLSYVVEKAQKLWNETRPQPGGEGPAYGYQAQTQPGHSGRATIRYGEQPGVNA